jgi:hypothetical protein
MALVKYGGGIVQMSGSIAGNVFARNAYGNYVRARTKPANPSSTRQQAVRATIAYLTEYWFQTLEAAERAAWEAYAAAVMVKNRLGESVHISGFNHFVRSNALLHRDGKTIVDSGPTELSIPDQDVTFAIAISEATQEISVTFDDTLGWAGEVGGYLFIFMGTPQPITRNFFGGPWRFGDTVDGAAIPPTSPAIVACPFYATAGQKVWAYARIARADGRVSEPFRGDCVCAA